MSRLALCTLLLLGLSCLCGFRHMAPRSFLELAQMYEGDGQPETALRYYDKAVAAEPTSTDLYLARAFFLLKQGKADEGIRDLSVVIALAPDKPEGYLSRGLVRSERGEKELARQDFAMACRLGDRSGCQFLGEAPR